MATTFLKCLCSCSLMHTSSSQTQRQYPTVIEELCHQFSLADLRKSTNNFDENRVLGRGRFGKVYKGYLQHNDASDYTVAIKRMDVASILQGSEEVFKNEIKLLCQLRHPNLITLTGFCDHETEKILVYEYMSNGSLDDHLLRRGDMEALSWKKRVEICIGAARGLHYLHTGAKHTILHRDLKPSNILLDHNMEPKLADFAFSMQGPHSMSKPKPIKVDYIAGTLGYIATEYFTGGIITDKCDVYSFGRTLLEVVCGMKYLEMLIMEAVEHFEEIIDPDIKGNIAPECWELYINITQRCLELEPEERPTMGEVEVQLEHALLLQEQADIRNTNGDYTLLSTTVINWGRELQSKRYYFMSSATQDSVNNIEDIYSRWLCVNYLV